MKEMLQMEINKLYKENTELRHTIRLAEEERVWKWLIQKGEEAKVKFAENEEKIKKLVAERKKLK